MRPDIRLVPKEESPPRKIDWGTRARQGYADFRMALIQRILSDKLNPTQVADILSDAADEHSEITYAECRRYREMGESWLPWNPAVAQP